MAWKVKTFGDILSLEYGRPLDKSKRNSDGLYPAYGANGVKTRTDEFYYDKPTIIVGRKGSAGELTLSENKFWPLDVTYFVKFDEKKYDLNFLYYLLEMQNLPSLATGVKPGINRNNVYVLKTKIPDLEEQKCIVEILDELFEQIDQAKANVLENLKNARELFDSSLGQIFTERGDEWQECTLSELGTITSSKRIFKHEYVDSGVPFYRTKEIKELANNNPITTELFISQARYNEIKSSFGIPQEGDILMTAIGTIGEVYVVERNPEFYFKDGNVLWLKGFDSIIPMFLRYILVSFVDALNKMSHGAAYNALPIQKLKAHAIYLPSKEEQSKIVAKLDALQEQTQSLEAIYQQKNTALDELKQSLLQKAFSGERTQSLNGDAA